MRRFVKLSDVGGSGYARTSCNANSQFAVFPSWFPQEDERWNGELWRMGTHPQSKALKVRIHSTFFESCKTLVCPSCYFEVHSEYIGNMVPYVRTHATLTRILVETALSHGLYGHSLNAERWVTLYGRRLAGCLWSLGRLRCIEGQTRDDGRLACCLSSLGRSKCIEGQLTLDRRRLASCSQTLSG